jgi:predicted ester cyclase
MNAGVMKGRFKRASLDKVVEIYREIVLTGYARVKGARGGQLWLNRGTGDALAIGLYDSPEAAKAFAPIAEQAQTRLEPYREGPRTEREFFELAASTTGETATLVEKGLTAFNAHDGEGLARISAPDIDAAAPGFRPIKGPQDVKEYNQNLFRAFPDAQVKADNLVVMGSWAVLEGTFTGTNAGRFETPLGEIAPTGKRVNQRFVQVIQVDRGLVKAFRNYYDQMEMMAQLGLAPAQATTITA